MWHTEHQWMLFSFFKSISPRDSWWFIELMDVWGRRNPAIQQFTADHRWVTVSGLGWNRSLGFFDLWPLPKVRKRLPISSHFSAVVVTHGHSQRTVRIRSFPAHRGGWGSVFSSHQGVQVGSNGRPRDRAVARQQGQDTDHGLDEFGYEWIMGWKWWWNKQK